MLLILWCYNTRYCLDLFTVLQGSAEDMIIEDVTPSPVVVKDAYVVQGEEGEEFEDVNNTSMVSIISNPVKSKKKYKSVPK